LCGWYKIGFSSLERSISVVACKPTACGNGFNNAPDCNTCYAANYFDSNTSVQACVGCPAKSYCTGGLDYPRPCPAGNYCAPYRNVPERCPIKAYCQESVDKPTYCAEGYTSPAGSTDSDSCLVYPCINGATNIPSCNTCYTSNYFDNSISVCSACPAGSYCIGGIDQPKPCPKGSYCSYYSASPKRCPVNTYCGLSTQSPNYCLTGYSSPSGSSVASACTKDPCTNRAINFPDCNNCNPRNYFDSVVTPKACLPCPAGSYCVGGASVPQLINPASAAQNCESEDSNSCVTRLSACKIVQLARIVNPQ
jgi:hypothetical protein